MRGGKRDCVEEAKRDSKMDLEDVRGSSVTQADTLNLMGPLSRN